MALQLPRYRFSVEQYEQMIAAGIIDEDMRIELIDGEIVEMSPMGPAHVSRLSRTARYVERTLGDEVIIINQSPIRLPPYGEPEPDLTLLRPDYPEDQIPGVAHIFCVIEVADSAIATDRRVKLPLYAASGIAETWLFDINQRTIERHTDPRDGRYQRVATARGDRALTSTVLPNLTFRASQIFG